MDEVEELVADSPSTALSLVAETERLYMALELIAFSTRDEATATYAKAILDPVLTWPR